MDTFDVIVVGGGVAGMQAAFKSVARGKRTALIEKERLGGTCLTRGCIPTKAMIRSAEVAHLARRGAEFGVRVGPVSVDLARVVARKNEVVDEVVKVNEDDVAETEEMTFFKDTARFVDPHTMEVGGQRIRGETFILATGAKTTIPAWPGIDKVRFLTSRTLLDLTDLPERLLVVGGGYIGVECAQMMARFGARVTLLARSTILKDEDPEIVAILRRKLEKDGVEIFEWVEVLGVSQTGAKRLVSSKVRGAPRTFEGDQLLLAIGRGPNASVDLARAGVATWGAGWVKVDDRLRTSQPHIWAVGDCIGRMLFTHVARYEVEVAIANALDGGDVAIDYWAAPYAIFTDPELARVGMTLQQAVQAGFASEETVFTYENLGKALCLGERDGMMKVVTERGTGRLLGFHALASHAGELVHEAVVQMHRRGTVDDLADAIHIHPTLAEGVNDAAFAAAIGLGRRRF